MTKKTMLDITGDTRGELGIPVPQKAKDRLTALNATLPAAEQIVIPDEITLYLVESDLDERRKFSEKEALLRAQNKPEEYMTELMMMRAASDTDERVVREMIRVAVPSKIAAITHACIHGELPKVVGG